jgi:hypothetical protein
MKLSLRDVSQEFEKKQKRKINRTAFRLILLISRVCLNVLYAAQIKE